jgi:hypothetical protein
MVVAHAPGLHGTTGLILFVGYGFACYLLGLWTNKAVDREH